MNYYNREFFLKFFVLVVFISLMIGCDWINPTNSSKTNSAIQNVGLDTKRVSSFEIIPPGDYQETISIQEEHGYSTIYLHLFYKNKSGEEVLAVYSPDNRGTSLSRTYTVKKPK
jgi:hypothetical protein